MVAAYGWHVVGTGAGGAGAGGGGARVSAPPVTRCTMFTKSENQPSCPKSPPPLDQHPRGRGGRSGIQKKQNKTKPPQLDPTFWKPKESTRTRSERTPIGERCAVLTQFTEEFRAVQKYLTEAMNQDNTITWFCYSSSAELPTKVAVRGLPLDTPPEEVLVALQELRFPAEQAKAIPPEKGRHGCTYIVQLAYLREEELTQLYRVTELLAKPVLIIEAWRGN
ncbi:unnamed protein product [Euphydryas editha]|uniref:Uncharacterized protein n=1 Tax=Euphydryas editha TaxID=104508 RepID=A0AAU9UZE6_EUPED|nr:unnamed protein product [Euphydryas editha]